MDHLPSIGFDDSGRFPFLIVDGYIRVTRSSHQTAWNIGSMHATHAMRGKASYACRNHLFSVIPKRSAWLATTTPRASPNFSWLTTLWNLDFEKSPNFRL